MKFIQLLVMALLLSSLPQAQAEIQVGAILPLSGGTQQWGEGIRRGLEVYQRTQGKDLKFIFEDEAFCDSRKAVTAAKKLLEVDGVRILVTGCLNGTKAIQPIAERYDALVLSAGLLDEQSILDYGNVVSLSAQIGTEAEYLSRYIESSRYRRLVFFRHEDNFTLEFHNQLVKKLTKDRRLKLKDVPVVDAAFPWKTELSKSRSEPVDAYIVYLGNDELLNFMKAKRILKDQTPVLSGYIIESNFDVGKFGSLLDGVVFTYPALADRQSSKRRKFELTFKDYFGTIAAPTVNTYFVFDGMKVLSEALSNCGGYKMGCVKEYFLSEDKEWEGVSGSFTYHKSGAIKRVFDIKIVKKNGFVEVVK